VNFIPVLNLLNRSVHTTTDIGVVWRHFLRRRRLSAHGCSVSYCETVLSSEGLQSSLSTRYTIERPTWYRLRQNWML